jgi:predicted esterase YcpF (UPF0227 family)
MTKRVLYFHGFASSPASAKIRALRPMLEPRGFQLVSPDLNIPSFERLDFDAIVETCARDARDARPDVLVGSSLGSLVALSVAARGIEAPLVLIAPALGVAQRWSERIPDTDPVTVFNYARNAEVPIHKRFFEQMAVLEIDRQPPRQRVIALMGRKDETVPFDIVEETWQSWVASGALPDGSRFIELSEGDHSLVAEAATIASAIEEVAR